MQLEGVGVSKVIVQGGGQDVAHESEGPWTAGFSGQTRTVERYDGGTTRYAGQGRSRDATTH